MLKKEKGKRIVAENRKARYNYEILDVFEAGLQLAGTEIKSLRENVANISEAYASPEDGELFLINAWIPEYSKANRFNHDERRKRKLLMHRREIDKLCNAVSREGMTIVPLELYINVRGVAKLRIALALGKKLVDKRETQKQRDWDREKARLLHCKG